MSVYLFAKNLSLDNVDKTSIERHFSKNPNILDRNYIHKLQDRFHELGFGYMVGNINGVFNEKLRATVTSFQAQARETIRRCYDYYNKSYSYLNVPITFNGSMNGKFDFETANELDLWLKRGYRNSCDTPLVKFEKTWIRKEIADKLFQIEEKVRDLGGMFPLDFIGCFRNPSNITKFKGMKHMSLHKAGLAIDLDEWRGMQDLEHDYYFISSDHSKEKWEVFLKSKSNDIPETSCECWFYDHQSSRYQQQNIRGKFINLTKIFVEYGLQPISRHNGWENNYYLSEWWHFQLSKDNVDWFKEMSSIGYSMSYLEEIGYVNNG